MRLTLYYHTIRQLRFVQIYGRLVFRFAHPTPRLDPAPPLRRRARPWVKGCERQPSMCAINQFVFLNIERAISGPQDWNKSGPSRLWLYNLHYFDDLNAAGAPGRCIWHERILSRWISENPPGIGVGWEPYPTSLRIVNWIKWDLTGNPLSPAALHSLAVQARFLSRRIEKHLLGNHLLANAKALVFAGLFFMGSEADGWLSKGRELLQREIPEQILKDGGHFERSPMYHAIALEDLLDLMNLSDAYGQELSGASQEAINAMRSWLQTMAHPDGEIALFNDAATGIACSSRDLDSYANRLGLPVLRGERRDVVHLADSGYVRVEHGPAVLLLDVAPVGPDYLPAHAHADTLSFELSLFGVRTLVNSGTSVYGVSAERDRQRGTAAHNALVVDGENSSEVWAGFRVARRARVFDLEVSQAPLLRVCAAHDGYQRLTGHPIHRREWLLQGNELAITDSVSGSGRHEIEVFFHLHPEIEALQVGSGKYKLSHSRWPKPVSLSFLGPLECDMRRDTYHPEFGLSIETQCLRGSYSGLLPVQVRTEVQW